MINSKKKLKYDHMSNHIMCSLSQCKWEREYEYLVRKKRERHNLDKYNTTTIDLNNILLIQSNFTAKCYRVYTPRIVWWFTKKKAYSIMMICKFFKLSSSVK